MSKSHGKSNTRLYEVWENMKSRCFNKNNPKYHIYGGRGIKVCKEWQEFMPFYNWAIKNGYDGTLPKGQCTLDRIDVNKNYEPSNCRFITIQEQQYNRQNNRLLTYKGQTKTLTEWSKIFDINYKTLENRISNGWDLDRAFKEKPTRYCYITYNGETKTIAEWVRYLKVPASTFKTRIYKGWSLDRIFNEPFGKRGKNGKRKNI